MAPFLIQIIALPFWAITRLESSSDVRFRELLLHGWPLLLVPVLAVGAAVYWRLRPDSSVRLNAFAGAGAGAACIAAFFVFVLTQ